MSTLYPYPKNHQQTSQMEYLSIFFVKEHVGKYTRKERYQCTVRREIFEVAMVKFINIKKRRDLTADLKVRIDTGALNDFKK